jgi:hypothetical protein
LLEIRSISENEFGRNFVQCILFDNANHSAFRKRGTPEMSGGEKVEVAPDLEMGWSYTPIKPQTRRPRNESLRECSSNDLNTKVDEFDGR